MKYFSYVWRNMRRNRLRTCLTIGSIAISLFLMMIMLCNGRADPVCERGRTDA